MRIFTVVFSLFVAFALVGNTSAAGFFGAKFPPLPAGVTKQAKAQEEGEEVEVAEEPRDFVDPQELKDALKQTKEQLQEIKRLTPAAKKAQATKELEELAALQQRVVDFQKQLKTLKPDSDNARETLQDYYDSQLWDALQEIRRRVELPREIADVKRSLVKVEKMLAAGGTQKAINALGANLETIRGLVAKMRAGYDAAAQALASGDAEATDDALSDFREDGHPGELEGMLHVMRGFHEQWRRIKDTEIQEGIKTIIAPIIEALHSGDIREARITAEELGPRIEKIMKQALRIGKKGKERSKFLEGIEKLEQLINEKLGSLEKKGGNGEEGGEASGG